MVAPCQILLRLLKYLKACISNVCTTNFIYTGATKARTDKFTGSKTFRKACKRALQYPVMDYPKGDKKEYVLGDFIKPDVYLVIK